MSFPEIQFFYCLLSLVCYEHQGIFCNCFLKFPVSAVTLDDKALLLLLNKKNDEDFPLCWKGYGVEFCAFCDAIRVIISPDIFLAFTTTLTHIYLRLAMSYHINPHLPYVSYVLPR